MARALPRASGEGAPALVAVSPGWAFTHTAGPTGLCALDDGGAVVVDVDGHVVRWDARGRPVWTAEVPTGPAYPDLAADAGRRTIVIAAADGRLHLLSAADGHERAAWAGGGRPFGRLSVDAAGERAVTVDSGGEVTLWDLGRGTRRVLVEPATVPETKAWSVALSPDGAAVAAGFLSGEATVWRLDERTPPRTVRAAAAQGLPGGEGGARSVALTRGGERLLTGGGGNDPVVRVWDVRTGAPEGELVGHEGNIAALEVSPDGRRLLSAAHDGVARIWDLDARRELVVLRGHGARLLCAGWSPDGARVATSGSDQRVLVWDAATGARSPRRSRSLRALAASDDGRFLVAACSDGAVERWDLDRGAPDVAFVATGETPHELAVGAGGRSVALGTVQGAWLLGEGASAPVRLTGAGEVFVTGLTPEGALLVGSRDGGLRRFSPAGEGPVALTSAEAMVRGLALTTAGIVVCTDAQVQLLRPSAGVVEGTTLVRAIPGGGVSLSVTPDGRRGVVAGVGRAARVDLERGTEVPLPGGSFPAAISADGRRAVTGGAGVWLLVWDLERGRVIGRLTAGAAADTMTCARFVASDVLLVGTARGALLRYRMGPSDSP
jgi:WD40 repeat protein